MARLSPSHINWKPPRHRVRHCTFQENPLRVCGGVGRVTRRASPSRSCHVIHGEHFSPARRSSESRRTQCPSDIALGLGYSYGYYYPPVSCQGVEIVSINRPIFGEGAWRSNFRHLHDLRRASSSGQATNLQSWTWTTVDPPVTLENLHGLRGQ